MNNVTDVRKVSFADAPKPTREPKINNLAKQVMDLSSRITELEAQKPTKKVLDKIEKLTKELNEKQESLAERTGLLVEREFPSAKKSEVSVECSSAIESRERAPRSLGDRIGDGIKELGHDILVIGGSDLPEVSRRHIGLQGFRRVIEELHKDGHLSLEQKDFLLGELNDVCKSTGFPVNPNSTWHREIRYVEGSLENYKKQLLAGNLGSPLAAPRSFYSGSSF